MLVGLTVLLYFLALFYLVYGIYRPKLHAG